MKPIQFHNEMGNSEKLFVDDRSQFPVIFVLFIFLHLTVLLFYSPQGLFTAYTDFHFYFRTAQMSDSGYFPFINMWYEYPPIPTYIVEGVYLLTRSVIPNASLVNFGYVLFSRLLGMVLLIFECGNLVLIYAIVKIVWGDERATWISWIYSILGIPLFFWNASHNTIVVFFFLLALFLFIQERWVASAVAVGLGIASKLTPVLLFAPVIKYLWDKDLRKAFFYLIFSVLTTVSIYLPFLLLGGKRWVIASFLALAKVSSWGTPWAILDRNWGPGNFGPIETRIHLELASNTYANPALLPEYLKTLFFVGIFGVFFYYSIRLSTRLQFIWFSTVTLLVFHLWSKGWSPQWSSLIIPFLLISWPDRRGLIFSLLLSCFVFIEWPIAAVFSSHELMVIAISGRIILFMILAVLAAAQLLKFQDKQLIKRQPAHL